MLEILKPLAYLGFHLVVWASLFIGKLIYPPMRFPKFKKFLKILPVSLFFIIWDALVTDHWWYFAPHYTLAQIGPLPIEEILFFFSIPYALLVITENLHIIWPKQAKKKLKPYLQLLLISSQLILITIGLFALTKNWQYTATISLLSIVSFRQKYWSQAIYRTGFILTIITTFIFNFYLTALPIVTYNQLYKSPIKILTIPIEDFFYGILFYSLIFQFYYEQEPWFSTNTQKKD